MWLMAGLAGQSAAVLLDGDLREALGPRAIHGMATDAEHGGIQFPRLDSSGILGVLCERAVARFAVDARMLSLILCGKDIGMAILTRLVPGKHDWLGRDFRDRVSAVVPIFAEAFRDQGRPHEHEGEYPDHKDQDDAQQMLGIFEALHCWSRSPSGRPPKAPIFRLSRMSENFRDRHHGQA